jgi:hypothetical protein
MATTDATYVTNPRADARHADKYTATRFSMSAMAARDE